MNNGIPIQSPSVISMPLGLSNRAYSMNSALFPSIGSVMLADSLYEVAVRLTGLQITTPQYGGALVINGINLGSYDYCVRPSQVLSRFSSDDWFTNITDTRSAWCVVNGNLFIPSGTTFIPSVRKLFTVLVVNGDLTVNGSISMTGRGANHSGAGNSGGLTPAANIRIATGIYSGIENPQVPAAGGATRNASLTESSNGLTGNVGSNGGTGGGGTGGWVGQDGSATAGSGAAGTSFSGGAGGGGVTNVSTIGALTTAARSANTNGGAGGPAGAAVNVSGAGGTGNPGGAGCGTIGVAGNTGTGGVLIIFCLGALLGSGSIVANGVAGGGNTSDGSAGGGGSGGGSVTVLCSYDLSSITPTANGGAVGNSQFRLGGAGGAGTARKLILT